MGVTTKRELLDGMLAMGCGERLTAIADAALADGDLPSLDKLRDTLAPLVPEPTFAKVVVAVEQGVPEPNVDTSAILHEIDESFNAVREIVRTLEKRMLSYKRELEATQRHIRSLSSPSSSSAETPRRKVGRPKKTAVA